MKNELKKFTEILIDLDKKAKELDDRLQEIRMLIHTMMWDFIEMKKSAGDRNTA